MMKYLLYCSTGWYDIITGTIRKLGITANQLPSFQLPDGSTGESSVLKTRKILTVVLRVIYTI